MRETEIDVYAALMQKWGLSRLSVTEEGTRIRLERPAGRTGAFSEGSSLAENVMSPEKTPEASGDAGPGRICVTSPMVGVFYASPAENVDPFVTVGDPVKKGETLCIIEAMKLMNEIRAETDGVVERVCVTNGQVVEYGTELFWLKETEEA